MPGRADGNRYRGFPRERIVLLPWAHDGPGMDVTKLSFPNPHILWVPRPYHVENGQRVGKAHCPPPQILLPISAPFNED